MSHPWLTEEHEWTGKWWIPKGNDGVPSQVSGTLRFTPQEGLSLTLIGSFGNVSNVAVIHGFAEGSRISLFRSLRKHARGFGIRDFVTESYSVEVWSPLECMVGVHADDLNAPIFDKVTCLTNGAWAWEGNCDLRLKIPSHAEFFDQHEPLSVAMRSTPDQTAQIRDYCIVLEHSYSHPKIARTDAGITVSLGFDTLLTVVPPAEISLLAAREELATALDLISLSLGVSTQFYWIKGRLKQGSEHNELDTGNVEFYSASRASKTPPEELDYSNNALLTLEDLPFEDTMVKWYAMWPSIGKLVRAILADRYASDPFLETRVRTAITAVEALDRALDSYDNEWADPNLEFQNAQGRKRAPFLRERLKRVLDNLPTDICSALTVNLDRWLDAAKDIRNDLSHESTLNASADESLSVLHTCRALARRFHGGGWT